MKKFPHIIGLWGIYKSNNEYDYFLTYLRKQGLMNAAQFNIINGKEITFGDTTCIEDFLKDDA